MPGKLGGVFMGVLLVGLTGCGNTSPARSAGPVSEPFNLECGGSDLVMTIQPEFELDGLPTSPKAALSSYIQTGELKNVSALNSFVEIARTDKEVQFALEENGPRRAIGIIEKAYGKWMVGRLRICNSLLE